MARGRIVLEARTGEPDLPHRLEDAYFGQDVPSALHA
jgi:branched-chain amino acid transport system ATP-binding protein